MSLSGFEEDYNDMLRALVLFGLSDREARIYLSLLTRGEKKASELARELRIHRLDIYNALKSLQAKEIVEARLSMPMVFMAVPWSLTIKAIRRKHREDTTRRENALAELESGLRRLDQITGGKQKMQPTGGSDRIQIVSGRKAIREKWLKLLSLARKEILIVATEGGAAQSIFLAGVDTLAKKIRIGVSVRVFTPVTKSNAELMIAIRPAVRHLVASTSAGICIVDSNAAIIVTDPPAYGMAASRMDGTAIMTNNKSIVEMLRTLFFVGWDTSPIFEEVITNFSPDLITLER